MAKVKGPLFSMEATGTYGGAVTFGKWKGRPYARIRVDPANPNAAGQESARNRMRATGAMQRFVNNCTLTAAGETLTDKARIAAITPSGQSWNGYLVKMAVGAGGLTWTAAMDAYNALQAGEKTAWVNAAEALTPAFPEIYQTVEGGGAGTALTPGAVFFAYVYALSAMGLATTPGATPPVYS